MMMSSLKLALIFGAALGLYQFNAQNTNYLASVVPQYNTNNTDQLTTPTSALQRDPGFDYFLFVLQWPAAFCNIKRSYGTPCDPIRVRLEHRNKFTVHGLWPQLKGAKSPLMRCQDTKPMQDSDLNDVEKNALLVYWPNLLFDENRVKSQDFWKYEWNKHGTCSSNKFTTPREYFGIALKLARDHSKRIFNGLQDEGIKPDGTTVHRLEDLRKNVTKLTGRIPILNIGLNRYGDHLLREIKLCVKNDGFTLMDCDEVYKFAAP